VLRLGYGRVSHERVSPGAHKKATPSLGLPREPRHGPIVGSYGVARVFCKKDFCASRDHLLEITLILSGLPFCVAYIAQTRISSNAQPTRSHLHVGSLHYSLLSFIACRPEKWIQRLLRHEAQQQHFLGIRE